MKSIFVSKKINKFVIGYAIEKTIKFN
jgi:hypothetical protein